MTAPAPLVDRPDPVADPGHVGNPGGQPPTGPLAAVGATAPVHAPRRVGAVEQAVQQALVGLVRGYQLFFSPWLGTSCRFAPSCSHYALQALAAHGPARGSLLAARRLLRCHPWCDGGLDPVPPRLPVSRGMAPPPSSTDPTP